MIKNDNLVKENVEMAKDNESLWISEPCHNDPYHFDVIHSLENFLFDSSFLTSLG